MPSVRTPLPLAAALTVFSFLAGCGDAVPPVSVLVEDEYGISGIAVDEGSVYFIKKDGTLKSVSIDGGPAEEIASGITDPRQIAVDATDVYWATSTGTIARTAKKGGASAEPVVEGLSDLREMVLDNASVYFTVAEPGALHRIPKSGATDELLAEATEIEQAEKAGPLAHHAGILFWANQRAESGIHKMTVSGSGVVSLADAQPQTVSIAADPSFVYWANFGDGTVTRASVDGSDVRVIAYDQPELYKVIGDGTNAYWSSLDGSIATVPVEGEAEPFVMSTGPAGPTFLAQDEGFLYSARFEAGTIIVRPKPAGAYE